MLDIYLARLYCFMIDLGIAKVLQLWRKITPATAYVTAHASSPVSPASKEMQRLESR